MRWNRWKLFQSGAIPYMLFTKHFEGASGGSASPQLEACARLCVKHFLPRTVEGKITPPTLESVKWFFACYVALNFHLLNSLFLQGRQAIKRVLYPEMSLKQLDEYEQKQSASWLFAWPLGLQHEKSLETLLFRYLRRRLLRSSRLQRVNVVAASLKHFLLMLISLLLLPLSTFPMKW